MRKTIWRAEAIRWWWPEEPCAPPPARQNNAVVNFESWPTGTADLGAEAYIIVHFIPKLNCLVCYFPRCAGPYSV